MIGGKKGYAKFRSSTFAHTAEGVVSLPGYTVVTPATIRQTRWSRGVLRGEDG